jgi:hypothetical protein
MAQLNRTIGGRKENIREMLLAAGIGQFNATMSIPYMYFLPRTCDPAAQGVIQIVEGLQNLLRARGERVPLDGWMGKQTIDAVLKFSGATWRDKSWMQIYGDVLRGRRAPGFERDAPVSAQGLDGYVHETGLAPRNMVGLGGIVDTVVSSPLALVAAGAAAYFFLGKKARTNPARRRRRRHR